MPSPDHCGRSPTTMTKDYMDILELSGDLLARKVIISVTLLPLSACFFPHLLVSLSQFVDSVDSKIKDVLDMKRNGTFEKDFVTTETGEDDALGLNQTFAGHGVLIVAKHTANDDVPLCLGLGPSANQVG